MIEEKSKPADRESTWNDEPWFGERWDVFCALPDSPRTILDVGCGGGIGFKSYRDRGARVVGVDIDTDAAEEASNNLDEAMILDVERDFLPDRFLGYFHVIAFCDCLEHLQDPWEVLRRMRPYLSEDGVVIASIPNVRQARIIAKLALGKWDYVHGAGTVQRGHVRFFTRGTITDMFLEAGYERPKYFFPARTFHLRGPERLLNRLTFGRAADLLYGSYTLAARPKR